MQYSGFGLFTGTRTRLWYCISLKGKSRRVGHFLCCDRDVFRGCQCLNLSLNHSVPHYNLPFISATPFLCSFFTLLFQAFVSLPLSSLLLVSFWTKTASVYTTASIQQTDHSATFPFPIRFYVTKEDVCVSWRPNLCTDNSSISFFLLVHFEIIPTFFHTALFLAALWFWLYGLIPSHLFNIRIKRERSPGNKLYTLCYNIFLAWWVPTFKTVLIKPVHIIKHPVEQPCMISQRNSAYLLKTVCS